MLIMEACTNAKKEWEQDFARTSCSLKQEMNAFIADSIDQFVPITLEKQRLQQQLIGIRQPFENRISALNKRITQAEADYIVSYRKETDRHSAQYGHNTTTAYERKMMQLKTAVQEQVSSLEVRISKLTREMEENKDFQLVNQKINELENRQATTMEKIKIKHHTLLDSLAERLFQLNKEYEDLRNRLSVTDRTNLERRRESMIKNPCVKKHE